MSNLPQSLIEKYKAGKIIPFVGAGVSMSVKRVSNGKGLFPSWTGFLKSCIEILESEKAKGFTKIVEGNLEIATPDYYGAADAARNGLGPLWYDSLKKYFDVKIKEVDLDSLSLPNAIWSLNTNLVVTTNFDKVLEWTCPEKDDLVVWDIEAKKEFTDFIQKGVDRPTVWHLHGTIDNTSDLIITPDGYKKLYPNEKSESIKKKYNSATETFKSILRSHSLLFIGFSMADDYIRNQLKAVSEIFEQTNGPHYILVREGNENTLSEKLKDLQNLKIVTFKDFGQPLVDIISELSNHVIDVKSEVTHTPSLLWRGGHYQNKTTSILGIAKERNKKLGNLLEFIEAEIEKKSIGIGGNSIWNEHRKQVLIYLSELIPDKVKKEQLTEDELTILYVLGQKSIFIEKGRGTEENFKVDEIINRQLNDYPTVLHYSKIILDAFNQNKDVVSRDLGTSEGQSLNFILGCFKLVKNLDLFFNRIPEKTYEELSPFNRLSPEEISRENFTIEKIDLDFNLHEIGIYAFCQTAISHQVLATLSDFLNQTLNSISQSLESKEISLLRVKFYPKNINYKGEHHEFRTQISTVISMFMGEELYGKQRVFIRELLQNARDAVLLRKSIVNREGNNQYVPKVFFEFNSEERTLICRDNGIGMDYYSIKRYLSDIGRSFYTSEDYKNMLKGVKKEEGNNPVSRFGIGLLSCFMVAGKVVIRTRMYGKKGKGYKIDIPSRGAFFFVSEDNSIDFVGTEVKLELKPSAIGENAKWTRPAPSVNVSSLDYGIKIKSENGYILMKSSRGAKPFVTKNRLWRLPRLVAYFASNLPFDIFVKDEDRESKICSNRLFQTNGKDGECYPVKFYIDTPPRKGYYDYHYTTNSKIKNISVGGIYVQRFSDFNPKQLGLPNWKKFYIDLAPERCRIDLARANVLSFDIKDSEREKVWKVVSSKVESYAKKLFSKLTLKSFLEPTDLLTFANSFPIEGVSLKREILNKFYKVNLYKYRSNGEVSVWSGSYNSFCQLEDIDSLYKVKDNSDILLQIEKSKIAPFVFTLCNEIDKVIEIMEYSGETDVKEGFITINQAPKKMRSEGKEIKKYSSIIYEINNSRKAYFDLILSKAITGAWVTVKSKELKRIIIKLERLKLKKENFISEFNKLNTNKN